MNKEEIVKLLDERDDIKKLEKTDTILKFLMGGTIGFDVGIGLGLLLARIFL